MTGVKTTALAVDQAAEVPSYKEVYLFHLLGSINANIYVNPVKHNKSMNSQCII